MTLALRCDHSGEFLKCCRSPDICHCYTDSSGRSGHLHISTIMFSSNRQVYLKRITTCHSEKMQMHREHCPDEPVLVNCAQVSEGCKSSVKQTITVESPDVMVSVWHSLAVSDLITPSICCSSAKSMAHEVYTCIWGVYMYRHVFSFILSISCTQDIPQLYHMCDSRCCFEVYDRICKALFLLTPANAIAHSCLFEACNFKHCVQSTISQYINSDPIGTPFAQGTLSCAYSLAT